MNKKIITILSLSLIMANSVFADYSYVDSSDFTGDAFFTPPITQEQESNAKKKSERNATMPPLKRARIRIKNKLYHRTIQKNELAPVAPEEDSYIDNDTSQFASQEIKDDFVENSVPDGFEADSEAVEEQTKRKFWQRKSKKVKEEIVEEDDSIILDCENVDYDTDTYCVTASGNVSVNFVKQNTVLKATKIVYDRGNNTIKAEGDVRIIKNGQIITGEYIFVDLNEENALIEKPVTRTATVEIKSDKGYLYGDKVVQENGSINVDNSFPIYFRSMGRGPRLKNMIVPESTMSPEDKALKLKTSELVITEKGDLEIISLKKASFFKGKKKVLHLPAVKLYTNKNFDFAETNVFEIGAIRGLGMYMGPGFVFEVPGGSVLKAIPMLNYNHGIGVGAVARYSSASNWTQFAYGTADSKFMVRGKQDLDDHLYLQYAMNDYMREWFLGRRRPKYGASLVYENGYATRNFLVKDQVADFKHRVDVGYYQEGDKDSHMSSMGHEIGTTRFRYMAQANQTLYSKVNKEKQTAFRLILAGQTAASVYGTGDTQIIGRIGPMMHTQYKRWMQDIGYYQSAYEDNTPMPVFDAYRYGKSNVFFRESFRLSNNITLSWFTSINLSGDAPNDRSLQENTFFVTFGPDDIKFSLGYDVERQRSIFVVEVMMDAKGTSLEYDRMEIKQDKKPTKKKELKDETVSDFHSPENKPVLKHAVVENVKIMEDVL